MFTLMLVPMFSPDGEEGGRREKRKVPRKNPRIKSKLVCEKDPKSGKTTGTAVLNMHQCTGDLAPQRFESGRLYKQLLFSITEDHGVPAFTNLTPKGMEAFVAGNSRPIQIVEVIAVPDFDGGELEVTMYSTPPISWGGKDLSDKLMATGLLMLMGYEEIPLGEDAEASMDLGLPELDEGFIDLLDSTMGYHSPEMDMELLEDENSDDWLFEAEGD